MDTADILVVSAAPFGVDLPRLQETLEVWSGVEEDPSDWRLRLGLGDLVDLDAGGVHATWKKVLKPGSTFPRASSMVEIFPRHFDHRWPLSGQAALGMTVTMVTQGILWPNRVDSNQDASTG